MPDAALLNALVTADELLMMGGGRCELVQGEVVSMSPPGFSHGLVASEVAYHLQQFVRQHRLGRVPAAETGFLLARNPDTVRAPDVAFVRTERLVATEGYFPGAPDLAVEVVSPGDRFSEVLSKVDEWLRAGAREVWVVDGPRRVVHVHRPGHRVLELTDGAVLDGGEVLPGLDLAVSACFPTEV
jgi:Uma2 family endonuclease